MATKKQAVNTAEVKEVRPTFSQVKEHILDSFVTLGDFLKDNNIEMTTANKMKVSRYLSGELKLDVKKGSTGGVKFKESDLATFFEVELKEA